MTFGEGDLERPDCPLCGPGLPRRPRHSFPPFAAVTCEGCGLVYLCPRLAEARALELYQAEGYFDSPVAGRGYDEYLEARGNWLRTFESRLRAIARHQPAGRALDVGCGPGFFLEAAASRGYEAWGVDPSSYAVQLAQRRFGQRVQSGVIETAPFPPGHFDLVTAFDAFEHVYRPLRFLEAAHALLAPGGLLAITTPDATSLLARLSGRRWVSFKVPEHVFYWSPRTIRRALEPRFDLVEITGAGQYASVAFLLRRLLRLGPSPRGPMRPLLAALGRINLYANNGSLTAIARRRADGGANAGSAGQANAA